MRIVDIGLGKQNMQASELKEIIEQHWLWIETNGMQGTRAKLDEDLRDDLQIYSLVVLLDTLDTKYMSYVKLLSSQGRVGWCQYYKTLFMLEEIS